MEMRKAAVLPAGAGLRPPGQVLAAPRPGQDAGLDRRAVLEAQVENGMHQFFG